MFLNEVKNLKIY